MGAILYRLLIGSPPPTEISDHVLKKRLFEKTPDLNVFNVPYFFEGYILSNDMCYIVSKLLCASPRHRYMSLALLKKDLLKLKENIYQTPAMLRKVLGHPSLPQETSSSLNKRSVLLPKVVEFLRQHKMNEFSLKYLAKFIYEHDVEQLVINGGPMPLLSLKLNQVVELNLRDQGLYSEDLFVLA